VSTQNPRFVKHLAKTFSEQNGWGAIGPVEYEVLAALWVADGPATLLDLHRTFPRKPYRTLVSTLDRLYKKGMVRRERASRANAYTPTMSRRELEAAIVGSIVGPRV
jgi:predicted transcriptional regulator